jgi:hypothetical protein
MSYNTIFSEKRIESYVNGKVTSQEVPYWHLSEGNEEKTHEATV